jgi:hypothetical protein
MAGHDPKGFCVPCVERFDAGSLMGSKNFHGQSAVDRPR